MAFREFPRTRDRGLEVAHTIKVDFTSLLCIPCALGRTLGEKRKSPWSLLLDRSWILLVAARAMGGAAANRPDWRRPGRRAVVPALRPFPRATVDDALSAGRAATEIRANIAFLETASFTNLLWLVTLNIPLWTVSSVFGLQAAGWFPPRGASLEPPPSSRSRSQAWRTASVFAPCARAANRSAAAC
jgi:hypothetical protein